MIKKLFSTSLLILSIITLCIAAELGGDWTGTMSTPDGQSFPFTYHLKVEGSVLTGTVDIPDSQLPIADGKVDGNRYSFNVSYNGSVFKNEGELAGDSLKVKVYFGSEIMETVAKRVN